MINRTVYPLMLLALLGVGYAVAEEAGSTAPAQEAVSAEAIQAMEKRLAAVQDPAARLFFQANIYRAQGELEKALQTLAELNVHHAYDKEWITRSELLTAKLYYEVGMIEQAIVTARQVEFLNEGTEAAETARRFREKMNEVKKQSEAAE